MGKIKKASFWVRRRSHLPIIVIGTVIVLLLYFNEDTSLTLNMEYEKRIAELKQEIRLNRDSTEYYRTHRRAIQSGEADLEYMAREHFRMQRPTEDVFIINEDPE